MNFKKYVLKGVLLSSLCFALMLGSSTALAKETTLTSSGFDAVLADEMEVKATNLEKRVLEKYENEPQESEAVYYRITEKDSDNMIRSQNSLSNQKNTVAELFTKEEYLAERAKENSSLITPYADGVNSNSWIRLNIIPTKKDTNTYYIDAFYTWLTYSKISGLKDVYGVSAGEGLNAYLEGSFIENYLEMSGVENVSSKGKNSALANGSAGIGWDFLIQNLAGMKLTKPHYGYLHTEVKRIGSGVDVSVVNGGYFHRQIAGFTPSLDLKTGSIGISPAASFDSLPVQKELRFPAR